MLRLDEPLVVECDNLMTLRLVTEESLKLVTKLRHVDVHNQWVSTRDMIADGLTKALPRQLHEEFVRQIRLDDISKRIQQEKRMVDL